MRLQQYLCKQLCIALYHLHNSDKVAHGDIKPDNIMITEDLGLVLIDFGHASNVSSIKKSIIGTLGYQAPEVTTSNQYSIRESDLYSLACSLFVIMFQTLPFGKEI
jgi:serine/threonine protein kinase